MGALREVGDRRLKTVPYLAKTALYAILGAAALCMTAPFVYMVTTSLKSVPESLQYPPVWLPDKWMWERYVDIWSDTGLAAWIRNSLFISTMRVLAQIATCSLAAYAFAYLRFKGKHVVFIAVLAVLMVPHQVVIIPQFLLMKQFGWLDSYWALIVPHTVGVFSIFLFRQYFLTLPLELIEAAKLDGCNPLVTLARIVLPNAKPVLTTMVLVTFLSHWNDFMWPLIVTNSKDTMVIPVGIANMVGEYSTNWPVLMTTATYATVPIIVLFLAGQRYFVEGMVSSGLKG